VVDVAEKMLLPLTRALALGVTPLLPPMTLPLRWEPWEETRELELEATGVVAVAEVRVGPTLTGAALLTEATGEEAEILAGGCTEPESCETGMEPPELPERLTEEAG